MALQSKVCPKARQTGARKVQLSCDGVSECRSNAVSIDVYSTRMIGCKNIFPHRLVRPIDKHYCDPNNHLSQVIQDLNNSNFKIEQFVADNLKRAIGKACLNHASLFPCEYCFGRGVKHVFKAKESELFKKRLNIKRQIVKEKIDALKNTPNASQTEIIALEDIEKELNKEEKNGPKSNTRIVWPASTRGSEPRTKTNLLEIVNAIEENPDLSKEERKGVVGRSPLWDIPHFDIVRDTPTEYMHTVCLGVVKRMLELTFSIGESRTRITKRKLSSPAEFNLCMLVTKVVREFSRRARKLDFSVMKAQELRNLLLFFFPHILQCIEPNAKERRLWLLLVFITRSCILPSEEFHIHMLDLIEAASSEFYTLYEKLFGPSNCTYNTHVVGSHMIDMRAHGPLTETSAFAFEGFYGEMCKAFAPGTQSAMRQIMEKIYIKRSLQHHCCENTVYFSENDTPLESNSLIYCFESNVLNMYKIIKVEEDSLLCYKQGKFKCSFKETQDLNLNWSEIGVFKKGGVMEVPVTVPKNKVSGKVLHVAEYLITCPTNVLMEK